MCLSTFRPILLINFLITFLISISTISAQQPPSIVNQPRCVKDKSFSCDSSQSQFPKQDQIVIKYANSTILNIAYDNIYVDFTVSFEDVGKVLSLDFRLVACGCNVPQDTPTSRTVLFTNPTNVFVEDGPALFMIIELFKDPEPLPIKYVNNLKFIYNERIQELAERKPPLIFALNAGSDIDFSFLNKEDDMSVGFVSVFNYKLTASKFNSRYDRPLMPIAESKEVSPLARAEWIKMIALIFNRTNQANTIFDNIVGNYTDAQEKASQAKRRPSVFFNYPFFPNDTIKTLDRYLWQQPGSSQYTTQFMRDANADYAYYFKGEDISGNLLSFTDVQKEFKSARFLVNADPFDEGFRNLTMSDFIKKLSPDKITSGDYTDAMKSFEAIRCENVWGQRKRATPDATDYLESGIVRPDIVLKDYVKILHPDVNLGDHQIYYMAQYVISNGDNLTCPHVNLLGNPSKGKSFVDKELAIVGLDRFELQNQLEDNIYPELVKRNISTGEIDVQFRQPYIQNEKDVNITVRIRTSLDEATDMADSTDVLDALRAGFEEVDSETITVNETRATIINGESDAEPSPSNPPPALDSSSPPPASASSPTPSASPVPSSSSSSLSGGVITAIVIAIVGILIIAVIIIRRRSFRRISPEWDPFTS